MNPQDAKRYLLKYRESVEKAAEISSNLADLKAEAENLKDHEGQRVGLDAAVAKYVDACKEAEQELDKLAAIRKDILAVINEVESPKLHSVLWRRYISGLNLTQVAVSMSYEYRQITRLHGQALQAVCEIVKRCP